MKIIKQYSIRSGHNFRVTVELLEDENGKRVFGIGTKRLVSREKREISEFSQLISPRSFFYLTELMKQLQLSDVCDDLFKDIEKTNVYVYENR